MKKTASILFVSLSLLLALVGCSSKNSLPVPKITVPKTTETDKTQSFWEAPETQEETETQIDVDIPTVTEKRKRPPTEIEIEAPDENVEESDDTELAMEFIKDYVNANLKLDPSLINLEDYIDNEYLKGFLKGNLELTAAQNRQYEAKTIRYKLRETKIVDGVNYIWLNYRIEYYIGAVFTNYIGASPTVAVKDGKVVNFADYLFKPIKENMLCDDITSSMAWKGYDLSTYCHLWDDDKAYNTYLELFDEEMEKLL